MSWFQGLILGPGLYHQPAPVQPYSSEGKISPGPSERQSMTRIIAMLAFPDFIPFLERQRFINTASQVRGIHEEIHWLAMTQHASHLVGFDEVTYEILLDNKRPGCYEELQRRLFP